MILIGESLYRIYRLSSVGTVLTSEALFWKAGSERQVTEWREVQSDIVGMHTYMKL